MAKETVPERRRVDLSKDQAAILTDLYARKRALEADFNNAIRLVGVDPAKVVGGNLTEDPHLVVLQ